jgi:predicted metallopeptidase
MLHLLTVLVAKIIMGLIAELKGMSIIEKILIVILFLIPVPFTMEGYLAVRTVVKKGAAARC